MWGLLGLKAGWIEGLEINILGLVAGIDVRQLSIKLPAFGQIPFSAPTARTTADPA
jgi:hypothetical protein